MLAVHVDQPLRARALVQIVDILRHDQELAGPMRVEPCQRSMGGVGLFGLDRGAARIVKAVDQIGIADEGFGRRHILNPVLFPKPAAVTEGVDTTFGRHARAGQDHDVMDAAHAASLSGRTGGFILFHQSGPCRANRASTLRDPKR